MSKLNFRTICLAIVGLLIAVPVKSQEPEKTQGNIKSIALVSTMIGKILQFPLPLMDAPPFNKKTNSIAPLIIKEEENSINSYREAVALSLKKQFNCEVLYGPSLIERPEYQEIIKKFNFPDNLKIDDENFPKIITPKDEANLFNFDNGKKVENFLKDEIKTKQTASEVCTSLGTDLIAVSYSYLWIARYGAFGGHAQLCLWTTIYLYNKDGKLVAKGNWDSRKKAVKAVGDDVMEYKAVLGLLPDILDEMMVKVSKKITAK